MSWLRRKAQPADLVTGEGGRRQLPDGHTVVREGQPSITELLPDRPDQPARPGR